MITQLVASALQVVIAAGMLFQIVILVRHAVRIARPRHAIKPRRAAAALCAQPCAQHRARRQRNYRLALKAARASVSA